jgi:hypothetical protein
MAHVVMTAHALLAPALAEAGVLGWLEELGLEVSFGEAWHLLAFDDSSQAGLMATVDFYPLDGGQATQVRMYLHRSEPDKPRSDLAKFLQELVETDPHWVLDGLETLPASPEVR